MERWFLIVKDGMFAIFVSLAILLVGLGATQSQGENAEVLLVVAPPSVDMIHLAEEAGGKLIGPTTALWGAFVQLSDTQTTADLRAAGAWAVFDVGAIASLCGVSPPA